MGQGIGNVGQKRHGWYYSHAVFDLESWKALLLLH